MNEVFVAGGIMLGVSGTFGVILAFADRFLRVYEDPRLEVVDEILPGTNCGACGEPGCHAFAEKLIGGEIVPGKCTNCSAEMITEIAELLGVDAGFQEKRVARLHCAGGKSSVRQLAEYRGLSTCRAAFVVNGGGRACPWGCLGLSDCEEVCDFDAIHMNDENLPVVDVDKCTACGDCVDACPLHLFIIEPISHKLIVQCSNPLAGDAARAMCLVTCDACGRCAMDSEEEAVVMEGGLPVIKDPARITEKCTFRCPTDAIQWVEGKQFEPQEVQ
ncbi:MAG: Fe-S cluster protein [bacterium]|nr:Fe-S cluster protein [bacterium]